MRRDPIKAAGASLTPSEVWLFELILKKNRSAVQLAHDANEVALYFDMLYAANWPGFTPPRWPEFAPPLTLCKYAVIEVGGARPYDRARAIVEEPGR
jgi:hypothetical protein